MKKQGESRSSVFRRSFRKEFPVAVRGEGVYVWDSAGNKYLDLAGSAAVNLIGHGVPEISASMAEQAGKLEFVHTSQFTTPIAEEYAEELLAFAGKHFEGGAVYFTCGGSESVETALLDSVAVFRFALGPANRFTLVLVKSTSKAVSRLRFSIPIIYLLAQKPMAV